MNKTVPFSLLCLCGYLYLFLLLSPLSLHAQHRLETHLNGFRPDDVILKQQVLYQDPGRSGSSVLWDFSNLSVVNESYKLAYYAGKSSVITGTEHLTLYNYTLSGDSLLLWGYKNQSTQMRNKQAELLLKFPVNYGDTIKNYYYGHGKHGNRLEMDAMGTIETRADAYGMMVLPDRDTLKQVLRTHTIKYIAKDTKPLSKEYRLKDTSLYVISPDSIDFRLANDSVIFVVETFRWYGKGYRYPVFETVRSWEQHREAPGYKFLNTAFFYPPREHDYLENDEGNLAILENENSEGDETSDPWKDLTYNVYPNPVQTTLEMEIYLPCPAQVRFQVWSTGGFLHKDESKGFHAEGVCRFQSNVSALPVGNYILYIWLDEHRVSEIIMKR